MKLLLPVAGKSSRFPDLRPKWLLTMPNGNLMIENALEGIDTEFIDEIIVIMLEDHQILQVIYYKISLLILILKKL